MAVSLPRLLRRAAARARALPARPPARLARPLGRDAARPLVRGRRLDDGRCSTASPSAPSSRAPRAAPTACSSSPSGRSATSSPATGSAQAKVTVTPNGVDPVLQRRAGRHDGYLLFVGAIQARKDPLAALAAARAVGLPLVVAGPEKDAELARRAPRRAAPTSAATSRQSELAEALPRRRGARAARRASRASGCRCSRRWPAARRSSPPTSRRCARSGATRSSTPRTATSRPPPARALADRTRLVGRRDRAREGLLLDRDGPADGRGLPAGARVKVSAIVVSHGNAAELAESLPALAPQVDELS